MTAPGVEITHTCTLEYTKVFGMEIVVGLLPLLLNKLGCMASKVVKSAKLPTDSSFVEFIAYWMPLNSALPIVVVSNTVL